MAATFDVIDANLYLFLTFVRRTKSNEILPEMGKENIWNKATNQSFEEEVEVSFHCMFIALMMLLKVLYQPNLVLYQSLPCAWICVQIS